MNKFATLSLALIYMFTASIGEAVAVPAYPRPVTYTQSDGTRITIRIVGDEYNHRVLSNEGYTLVGGPGNDYYYAQRASDGSLIPTTVKARPTGQLTTAERTIVTALPKGLESTASSRLKAPVPVQRVPQMMMSSVAGLTPPARITEGRTTGDLPALILLVQFSDIKFTVSSPQEAFNALLNEDGYNRNGSTGSAWNYYQDNSNKRFNPQFRVAGPYTVSKKASYYAGSGGAQYVPEMVVEACRQADADIDFSQYADNGTIRDIFIFYAGHNQAEGAANTIWPHRSDVRPEDNEFFDGNQLAGYACSSEYRGSGGTSMANIGTFCHEFGHVLGWPDFYDTDYSGSGGDAPALQTFSLMCSGSYNNESRTPPALNILERWMVGWCTPEEINESQTFELGSICDDKGLLIRTYTDNDYFLAEFRGTGKTVWDKASYINDLSGLMVYHVDYTPKYQERWTLQKNSVNAELSHECMKIVRATPSGINPYYEPGQPVFPGKENITSLTPDDNADYIAWSKSIPRLYFTNISLDKGILELTVRRIGGPELNLQAQIYQNDMLLNWTDPSASSWTVTWKLESEDRILGTQTVQTPELHIGGLQPAMTYEVTISATPASGEAWSQVHFLTTSVRGSSVPHIGLSDTGYTASQPILLTLLDYRGTPKGTEWFIDGKRTDSNYQRLTSGEHRITAVVTAADGSKEYIVKYITVN